MLITTNDTVQAADDYEPIIEVIKIDDTLQTLKDRGFDTSDIEDTFYTDDVKGVGWGTTDSTYHYISLDVDVSKYDAVSGTISGNYRVDDDNKGMGWVSVSQYNSNGDHTRAAFGLDDAWAHDSELQELYVYNTLEHANDYSRLVGEQVNRRCNATLLEDTTTLKILMKSYTDDYQYSKRYISSLILLKNGFPYPTNLVAAYPLEATLDEFSTKHGTLEASVIGYRRHPHGIYSMFDGRAYVTLPDKINNKDWTFSVTVRPYHNDPDSYVIASSGEDNGDGRIILGINEDGDFQLYTFEDEWLDIGVTISTDRPTNVTLVVSNSNNTIQVFKDGSKVKSDLAFKGIAELAGTIVVGNDVDDHTHAWIGEMKNLYIYNDAMSDDKAATISKFSLYKVDHNATRIFDTNGPVMYHPLKYTARDYSYRALGGSLRDDAEIEMGVGVNLDGDDDTVFIRQNLNITRGDNISGAIWAKKLTKTGFLINNNEVHHGDGDDNSGLGLRVHVEDGNNYAYASIVLKDSEDYEDSNGNTGNSYVVIARYDVPNNFFDDWHHYAYAFKDGNTTTLYIDGESKSSVQSTANVQWTYDATAYALGAEAGRGPYSEIAGYIADHVAYNRTLSDQEIKDIYNAQKGDYQ